MPTYDRLVDVVRGGERAVLRDLVEREVVEDLDELGVGPGQRRGVPREELLVVPPSLVADWHRSPPLSSTLLDKSGGEVVVQCQDATYPVSFEAGPVDTGTGRVCLPARAPA
jgi:hypothetical protein